MPATTPRFSLGRIDWLLILPVLLLIVFGLVSIYSATHNADLFVRFQKQVFWAVLGILVLILLQFAPPRFFHYVAYPAYVVSLLLLLLVLLFGKTVAGNAGWFGIAGYGIQPAEFAKIATILALGRFLQTARPVCKPSGIWRRPSALSVSPGSLS
jgi:rod shape determining protein RodA